MRLLKSVGIVLGTAILAGSAGVSAQDLTYPGSFVPITPCRIVDTRPSANAPAGPITGTPLTLQITSLAYPGIPAGANPCTITSGAPTGAFALAVNLTMTGVTGPADLRVAPGGTTPTSSIMNSSGATIANAAVLPVDAGGHVEVKSGGANFQLIVDVFGYYWNNVTRSGNEFDFIDSSFGYAIRAYNGNAGCGGTCGARIESNTVNGTSLEGIASDTGTGANKGVYGESDSTGNGSTGVFGYAGGFPGVIYGVYGDDATVDTDSAGVFGVDGSGVAGSNGHIPSGVRGESVVGAGVTGIGQYIGVRGILSDNLGFVTAEGELGYGGDAVFAFGDYLGTGAKFFIEPHPTDPGKQIKFVCLEGPESGTYFRGSAQIVNGIATIEVPESFRDVTDVNNITVTATPTGDFASLAVVTKGLDKIVVKGSSDVTFDYLVHGVRRAFKDFQAISAIKELIPEGPNDRHFTAYPKESQARFVANGIYNTDGTVNMATAQKMGWDKIWAARDAQGQAIAQTNAAEHKAKEAAEKAAKAAAAHNN